MLEHLILKTKEELFTKEDFINIREGKNFTTFREPPLKRFKLPPIREIEMSMKN